jgi:Multicopper oxidase
MFSFGPLSGLGLIQNGQPGTAFAADFNSPYTAGDASGNYVNGQPNPLFDGTSSASLARGANAAITDPAGIMNTGVINGNIPAPLMAVDEDDEYFLTLTNVGMIMRPDLFEQHTVHFHGYPNASSFYDGVPDASIAINIGGSFTYYYLAPDAGTYFWHCHITPPEHLQMGMVGQLFVRPRQNRTPAGTDVYQTSLAQQNDLRTACNPDPATQPGSDILCSAPLPAVHPGFPHAAGYKYVYNDGDGSTRYDIDVPIQIHGFDPNFHFVGMTFNPEGFSDMKDKYFLLNGRSYPDTVGVAGGPADVLGQLSSATNPDPVTHAISTADTDTLSRPSQPLPTLITLSASGGPAGTCGTGPTGICGQRAALRIADLDVQEYQTLSSVGIPMLLVGFNAKILRDQAGNNLYITTNSITLGGGESLDVILDSTGVAPGTYFLYTPQLDHLSNDAENFGGLMTEVVVTK